MDNLHERFRIQKETVLAGLGQLSLQQLRVLAHYILELSQNNPNLAFFSQTIGKKNRTTLLSTIRMAASFILANEQLFPNAGRDITDKIESLKNSPD